MHSHQSYPNLTTVIHNYEDSTNVDNSTIEPYKNRGLGKRENNVGGKKSTRSILYDIINCHPRVLHNYKIHGKLGVQLSFTNSTIGGGGGDVTYSSPFCEGTARK